MHILQKLLNKYYEKHFSLDIPGITASLSVNCIWHDKGRVHLRFYLASLSVRDASFIQDFI